MALPAYFETECSWSNDGFVSHDCAAAVDLSRAPAHSSANALGDDEEDDLAALLGLGLSALDDGEMGEIGLAHPALPAGDEERSALDEPEEFVPFVRPLPPAEMRKALEEIRQAWTPRTMPVGRLADLGRNALDEPEFDGLSDTLGGGGMTLVNWTRALAED